MPATGRKHIRPLTSLEECILAAVNSLADKACGSTIHKRASEIFGQEISLGSLYVAIGRLEKLRLLRSWEEKAGPRPVRGGRARKFFNLTDSGVRALRESLLRAERLVAKWT